MKLTMRTFLALITVLSVVSAALGCNAAAAADSPIPRFNDFIFGDLRKGRHQSEKMTVKKGTFLPEDIRTFTFNDRVTFDGSEAIAAAVLEAGKNPGLGVRSLHARGITGKGVRVAIIDNPKPQLHSEYKGKIVDYYNSVKEDIYEMHGPAVASLLVGEQCGTAPGAKLYYCASAGAWLNDASLHADALRWIITKNAELPADDKIRVVSVSWAPPSPSAWDDAVAEAKAAGILVLDCRDAETGITRVGYYDPNAPDDISRFTPRWANKNENWVDTTNLYAPAAYRTMAEEFAPGENHWQYFVSSAGVSWTVPYVAGVLAMGWQVNPKLTNDEMLALLRGTAYVTPEGAHVVNPVAFIEAIEKGEIVPSPQPDPTTSPTSPRFSDFIFGDLRKGRHQSEKMTVKKGTFLPEDIRTFTFNDRVTFDGSEAIAAAVLEAGKNPGLGVRSLHARGITGKGVRVAIIDQPKPQLHSEYKDKIVDYYNTAGEIYEMHGPAVVSLLVGNECGTAPDAKLYYCAAASWKGDSALYADALRWIITKNAELPADDKIRVVSVSAAPSGHGSPFTQNQEQWDAAVAEAKAAGILVLDCRNGETGITMVGYYDLDAPDDISRFTPGSPAWDSGIDSRAIYTPASCRTQAEEYAPGENHWQYTGDGGLSWTVPYVAGVLAMGWQVDPKLTNNEILAFLRNTAYVTSKGAHVVHPVAFIEAIEKGEIIPSPQPDPTTSPTSEPTTSPTPDTKSGGGGCDMGYGLFVMMLGGLVLHKMHR